MRGDMYKRIIQFNPSDFLLIEKLSNERAGDLFKCLLESAYTQDIYCFEDDEELDNLYSFFVSRSRDQEPIEEVYWFER